MNKQQQLILIPSDKMDRNADNKRNEHGLIRMGKITRESLKFSNKVEIYPVTENTEKRLNGSILLDIFKAFSEDLKKVKELNLSEEELCRVGFVTTKTFQKVTCSKAKRSHDNIWISENITNTVIGADPEFLLFDKGKVVRANNRLLHEGFIGSDGAMAEVRPKPAISPEELVENIKTLLTDKKYTEKIEDLDWVAGCYFRDEYRDYPIGGHIHIGNPIQIARIDPNERRAFFNSFNKILDELLAIPMIKVDGTEFGRARRTECKTGKYGYFGELRADRGRLEHRTLSGMWLMHPTLTKLVLGTAKAIIDEVFARVENSNFDPEYMYPEKMKNLSIWHKNFDMWKEIPLVKDMECTTSSKEMIDLLNNSDETRINAKFLKAWHNRMKKLSTYTTYAKYIDDLCEVLKNDSDKFIKHPKNIKETWLNNAKFI